MARQVNVQDLQARRPPNVKEVDILWITAGLSCDGDSVSVTNARLPSNEDAVQNTPIFEENGPDKFKGIDIMRAVRSFDPCLPCGVHMYLGNGKVLETSHSPMFGIGSNPMP